MKQKELGGRYSLPRVVLGLHHLRASPCVDFHVGLRPLRISRNSDIYGENQTLHQMSVPFFEAEPQLEDFVLFPERHDEELDISDFEHGPDLEERKASKDFTIEVAALRDLEYLDYFLTRLGKDARHILVCIDQYVRAPPKIDSGYWSYTNFPRGKKRKERDEDGTLPRNRPTRVDTLSWTGG